MSKIRIGLDPRAGAAQGLAAGAVARVRRSRLMTMMRPRTLVLAGDSNTAGNSVVANPPEYGPNYGELSAYLAGLRILRNAGVPGNTAAQLRARFMTDVVSYNPDVVTILIGTNNFVSGMADSAYTTLFNDLEACVLMALDAGILPIIVTPPPKNDAVTEAKRAQPFYYWLTEYYGIPLIDMFIITVDPTNGNYKSGYSDDGTHLNATGKAAVFPIVGQKLSDIPSLIGQEYRAAVSESTTGNMSNMIRNGSFSLGTAPSSITGWTTNTTNNTITLENPTFPETGKICKHVVSADGGIYLLAGSSGAVTAGHDMIVSGKIKTSGISVTTGVAHVRIFFGGGNRSSPIYALNQNGEFKFSSTFVVPSGETTFVPEVYINKAGTYEVSNLTLIDRTAMGAIWTPGQQGL